MTKTQQKYAYQMPNVYPPYNETLPASFVQASWNVAVYGTRHGMKRNSQLLKRMGRWYGVI